MSDARHEMARHREALKRAEDAVGTFAVAYRHQIAAAAAAIDPSLSPFGLRLARALAHLGPQSAGALAEHFVVDPSVVSRQLRQLEDLGLVSNEIDPNDRRCRVVSLTDVGVEKLAALTRDGMVPMTAVLATWSLSDLDTFASHIERLTPGTASTD